MTVLDSKKFNFIGQTLMRGPELYTPERVQQAAIERSHLREMMSAQKYPREERGLIEEQHKNMPYYLKLVRKKKERLILPE